MHAVQSFRPWKWQRTVTLGKALRGCSVPFSADPGTMPGMAARGRRNQDRRGAVSAPLLLAAIVLGGLLPCRFAAAIDGPMGVERVATQFSPQYQSKTAKSDTQTRWVQVDLGRRRKIDAVKLLPMTIPWSGDAKGFPARFKIEVSDDPAFQTAILTTDRRGEDYPDPKDAVGIFPSGGAEGRYVRLTATRLRQKCLALTKLEVISEGRDVAVGCPAADSESGNLGVCVLTRPARPQGEGVVTDNPGNVIPREQWQPVRYAAETPLGGVRLDEGLFKRTMENNIRYLLDSFTSDEMLHAFRQRAGRPMPPLSRPLDRFWFGELPGSAAGRFLMGAGNTLRWMDNAELRRRMDEIVDGIADCRRPDGYIMAYNEDTIFTGERAAYTRAWVTHGLIDAGLGGNAKVWSLLRGYYDWYDRCPYLPEVMRRGHQGIQGMIANTRMYFTPVGRPEDLQVVQRYFQENYWLDQMAAREDRAIWLYPYDRPHCYLLTSIEPYLDLYRATGAKKYLDAVLGAWQLYHDKWEHVGSSIAICEDTTPYPPKSYCLHRNTGELCGNVFWAKLSQRLHLLYPEEEKYVNEIEKSIYNVGIANQVGGKGIRYTARLVGHKDPQLQHPHCVNTCCEGQGTRLFGSLPEYLYSVAQDGLYVDLFAASTIEWEQAGQRLKLTTATQFPFAPQVRMTLSIARATRTKIHVRIPAWAAADTPVSVNDQLQVAGKPGTYVTLDRSWLNGDTIALTLPMSFTLTRYEGVDRDPGHERYALQYGPILMALHGPADAQAEPSLAIEPEGLIQALAPVAGKPLHFAVRGAASCEYLPYWEVGDEAFSAFPVVEK